jgi:hypothetical protein
MILQFAANPKFHHIPLRDCGVIDADALADSAFGECRPFRQKLETLGESGSTASALEVYTS